MPPGLLIAHELTQELITILGDPCSGAISNLLVLRGTPGQFATENQYSVLDHAYMILNSPISTESIKSYLLLTASFDYR